MLHAPDTSGADKRPICASDMQHVGFSHVASNRIPSLAPCVLELYVIKQFDTALGMKGRKASV